MRDAPVRPHHRFALAGCDDGDMTRFLVQAGGKRTIRLRQCGVAGGPAGRNAQGIGPVERSRRMAFVAFLDTALVFYRHDDGSGDLRDGISAGEQLARVDVYLRWSRET